MYYVIYLELNCKLCCKRIYNCRSSSSHCQANTTL